MDPADPTHADRRWPAVPRRPWWPGAVDLLVVCPHPDDESLGPGGLVAAQRAAGHRVVVIAATDGEAAYPDRRPAELAAERRREHREALAILGVGDDDVVRLGLPDGQLTRHAETIAGAIGDELARLPAHAVVVAPWPHDGHPDHEACGRAARAASGDHELVYFVVWGWFADTEATVLARPDELLELRLDAGAVDARREALGAHRSQLQRSDGTPIVSPEMVDDLLVDSELYVVGRGVVGRGVAGGARNAPIGSTSRRA